MAGILPFSGAKNRVWSRKEYILQLNEKMLLSMLIAGRYAKPKWQTHTTFEPPIMLPITTYS